MSSCIRCVGGIKMSYNEHLSYDQNGNIITLTRNGGLDSDTSVIAIDNLIYNYDTMYRLKKVIDFTGNPSGFKEGADNEDEYGYDKYGNMTRDDNKDITSITYNHLNLPKEIIFEDDENKKIIYLYNANGQKIKKTIFNSPNVSTVNYQSVFHYENGLLRFLTTAEGYVNFTTEGYNYIYNYTDHLGNIRVSYFLDLRTRSVAIIEENHYYPFGLKHQGYNNISPPNNVYKYKFLGQERQDELGLNWDSFRHRNYDYTIGRFICVDPLAEKFPEWSPYSFCFDNPLRYVDPDGRAPEDWWKNKSTGKYVWFNDYDKDQYDVYARVGYSYVGTSENDVKQDFKSSNNFFKRNFSKPKYDDTAGDIRPTVITAKTNNLIENWAESESLIGSISYNIANDFYLTAQVADFTNTLGQDYTNPITGSRAFTNLDNSPQYNANEVGFSFATTLLPAVGETKLLSNLKTVNASQFSKLFKGTAISRATPQVRGFLNRYYNKGVRFTRENVGSGIFMDTTIETSERLNER